MDDKNTGKENIGQRPIGFFDSGIGGLTVLKKLKAILPNEDYVYFGDTKNVPYGEKSKDQLLKIADEIFKFFEKQNVKAVVMACNTTSANTYEELKDKYGFKIYPIIQSCAGVIAQKPIKKVGIFATEATIKSGAYARELRRYKPDLEVFEIGCPPWVGIVEEKKQNEQQSMACVDSYLGKMLEHHPDKIVLGCTHYPYLLDVLGKFVQKDMFIDPSEQFAQFIKNDLAKKGLLNKCDKEGSEKFYVSASPENFQKASSLFYLLKEKPELVNL